MRRPFVVFGLPFLCLLPACEMTVRAVVRLGPIETARPRGCKVAVERIRPGPALAAYEQVGVICAVISEEELFGVARPDDSLGRTPRQQIEDRVCDLGGDLVTPVGICGAGGLQIGIFKTRAAR